MDIGDNAVLWDDTGHPVVTENGYLSAPGISKRLSLIVGVCIAISGFLFHLSLELKFDRLEVYDEYNVFFDADPINILYSYANFGSMPDAQSGYRLGIVHPNVETYFSAPVKIIADKKLLFLAI